jgi:hypothetical protein
MTPVKIRHNLPANWPEVKAEIETAVRQEYPDYTDRRFISVNCVQAAIAETPGRFPLLAPRKRQYRKLLVSYFLRESGFEPYSYRKGQVFTWARPLQAVPA